MRTFLTSLLAATALAAVSTGAASAQDKPADCTEMRTLNIGVSVAPPNVVHTVPYIADKLGYFAKRCIEPKILEFEGGFSATTLAAIQGGLAIGSLTEVAVGNGMPAKQIWYMAPFLPQQYVVAGEIKTPADLKGKRMSAAGGGVGSFNWRMGREILQTAGLTVDDAQFISQGTAGRLPGLVSGQLDGVALHPEDVYLAAQQKPDAHVLTVLSELLPNQTFNAYGASDELIARDRQLLVDVVAAMMEANRTIYKEKDTVIPIMMEATGKPQDAVEHAWAEETKNCVWSVNTGFDRARSEWTIQNSVKNGDIEEAKKPSFEQLSDVSIAEDALKQIGGPTEINGCKL
jgi:ABC-type nitrate/sulfonate/bicarbonate transport system substrate-binding protein